MEVVERVNNPNTQLYRAPNKYLLWAGIAGLIGYTLFTFVNTKLAQAFEALLLLAFIAVLIKAPARCRRDPMIYFLWAAVAVSVAVYLVTMVQAPKYAMDYPRLDQLTKPFLIMVVAWWLGGSAENTLKLYALAFAGIVLGVIYHFDYYHFLSALTQGVRLDYKLRNSVHTSAYLGVALMGWVAFAGYMLKKQDSKQIWLRIALWLVVFIWLVGSLIMAQTRAAWIGLALAFFVMACMYLVIYKSTINWPRMAKLAGATLAILLILLSTPQLQGLLKLVHTRMSSEVPTVESAFDGGVEKVRMDSIGARIHMWTESAKWIKERPLLGWGNNGRDAVIQESEKFDEEFKAMFGHLHNSAIEILLIYGLIGLVLLAALFVWIYWCLWKQWKKGAVPSSFLIFSIGFALFWVTMNMFESYIIFWTGTYINMIVLGGLYSFCLAGRQRLINGQD